MKILKFTAPFITAAAFVAAPVTSMAAAILLNDLLVNPSFEDGVTSNCPTGWACTNVSVAAPTSLQYPTPNGLVAPAVVPDGAYAAYTPVAGSNGILSQTLAGLAYEIGNSYALEFWVGNPSGGVFTHRLDVQLTAGAFNSSQSNTLCNSLLGGTATLETGVLSSLDNSGSCLFSLTPSAWQPADGDWQLYTLTFTATKNVVGDVGVRFQIFTPQSAENGALVHLDLRAPRRQVEEEVEDDVTLVPAPAGLALLGLGLLGLGTVRRRSPRAG